MDRILAIAGNTFRETNRNRVMYVLLLFAVLLILGSVTMGKLTLQDEARIIQDLGLAAISLFGVIIAVYLGVTVVPREIDQKTVYFVIPKPIRREEFLLGKFAGMCLTLVIQVAVMSLVCVLVLVAYEGRLTVSLAKALLLIQAEVMVVLSVALLLSSLTGPILAGFLSMAIFLLGRSTDFIAQILRQKESSSGVDALLTAAYYVLPDYHLFAVSGSVEQGTTVHNQFFTWGYVGWALGYAAIYVTIMLGLTILRFRRRDFV
ncbi:MAG: ABC transporter permease [Polyangia bacterium]|jgi:ABC-type transport system involved in multi-copper enzyme maturation permease subunit|nr:ABC transporter permease [Polyangia bacterium]